MEMMNYNPTKDGAVVAIRIYEKEDATPLAELAFAFGGSTVIEWTNVTHRNRFKSGINGYTFIFDERVNPRRFEDFLKPKMV